MMNRILGRALAGGKFGIRLALTVGGLFVGGSVRAATYYVATGGSDSAAGTNWTTAVKTIPVAVAKTVPGGGTVIVSNGTFTLTTSLTVSNATLMSLRGYTNTFVKGAFRTHQPLFVLRGGAVVDGFTMREYDGAAGVGVATIVDGTLQNCYIRGGTGTGTLGGGYEGYWGAVSLNGLNARIRNCVITKHRGRFVGAVDISTGGGTVDNCTLYGNTIYEPGYDVPTSQYSAGVSFRTTVNEAVRNCIIYNNTHTDGATLNFGRNVNASHTFDYSCTKPFPVGGDGIVTNPPAFVDAVAGNFHLPVVSPCINQGANLTWAIETTAVDLDGKPRKSGVRVDMGAYEFQVPLGTVIHIR